MELLLVVLFRESVDILHWTFSMVVRSKFFMVNVFMVVSHVHSVFLSWFHHSQNFAGSTEATQSWVTSQNYLTAVPSAISCNSLTMTSPITCTNPASPASWSQIGYSITYNNYTNNTVLYYNLSVVGTYSIEASFISLFVSSYYIMDFVNEVRTMQCSRVVYCSTAGGTWYIAMVSVQVQLEHCNFSVIHIFE